MNSAKDGHDSIIFLESISEISSNQLEGFFVGWPNPPSSEILLKILRNSLHCVIAFDTRTKRVIGFVNCISDCILSAYIPLVEVLPEYQHQGIGTELIKRMLEITSKYYMTDLTCDESMSSFYEKMEMTAGTSMSRRNYNRQSGLFT